MCEIWDIFKDWVGCGLGRITVYRGMGGMLGWG